MELDAVTHDRLLDGLRAELVRRVREALPAGTRTVALVDFPMHENVGDLAIWAGELAVLRELGVEVAYACDVYGYRPERLRRALPTDAAVLLHGGGNFGDVWPGFQRFRERVIADHPDRPVVQLPQTVHFDDPAAARRTGEVLHGHGGVRVLVRDDRSAEVLRELSGHGAVLCPDAATALRPRPAGAPRQEVVWLRREDHEAAAGDRGTGAGGPVPVDWPDHVAFAGVRTLGRLHRRSTARVPVVADRADRVLGALYAAVARRRTGLGLRMLAAGEVVVTDRLHAHILCCLLGRPHVVVDNSYGKVGGYVDRWTAASPLVHRAAGHREALALAQRLVRGAA